MYRVVMADGTYVFGPFVLDTCRRLLQRDGKDVSLGSRALPLLHALLDAHGQTLTKSELLEHGWPGQIVEEVNLSVQIAALRKALGQTSEGRDWISTVPRVGYRMLPNPPFASTSGPPTIAVLPFVVQQGDAEQESFGGVLADDLIATLGRFASFSVAARGTSLGSREPGVSAREAAKRAGVQYALEGSVRRQAARIRVAAQLVDLEKGLSLWADHFDGDLAGTFAFQDRVADAVAGLVEPRIRRAEVERAMRKRPDNLDAYDLCMRALPGVHGSDPARNAIAIDLLEHAIAMEPTFSTALAYAAWAYERRVTFGMPPIGVDSDARCLELAHRALGVGGDDPLALAMGGFIMVAFFVDPASGLAAVRRAAAANPNNPLVMNCLGISNVIAGDLDEALGAYRRAVELSPYAPENYESMAGMGFALVCKQEFEEALEWLLRAASTAERSTPIYWHLVACYAHLGRVREAKTALERLLSFLPGYTVAEFRRNTRRPDISGRERSVSAIRFGLVERGLRKAGLPER